MRCRLREENRGAVKRPMVSPKLEFPDIGKRISLLSPGDISYETTRSGRITKGGNKLTQMARG